MGLYEKANDYVRYHGYDELGSALFYGGLLMKLGDIAAGDRLLKSIPDLRMMTLRHVRDLINQSFGRLVDKGKVDDEVEKIMKEFYLKIGDTDQKVPSENIVFYLMAGYTFHIPPEAYDKKGNFTPRSLA